MAFLGLRVPFCRSSGMMGLAGFRAWGRYLGAYIIQGEWKGRCKLPLGLAHVFGAFNPEGGPVSAVAAYTHTQQTTSEDM